MLRSRYGWLGFPRSSGAQCLSKTGIRMNLIKQEENVKESHATQLISPIFGTVIGLAVGDPTGLSAAAISVFAKWGLDRFVPLLISKRQTVRLFQWGTQAAEGITQRLANGEKYREDGFFEKTPTDRSNIDEVIESTLKKVMETTEEPKIKFIANLTENVHFDSDFDLDTYRRILKILDELSYRQLCIIKLFMNVDQIDLDSLGNSNVTHSLSSILTDCFEVSDKGFINSGNLLMKKISELYLGSSGNYPVDSGKDPEYPGFPNRWTDVLSENMFKFAKLSQIPDEHVNSILEELKSDSTDAT